MILEEIDGDVKVVLKGKTLAVGDSIEDSDYALVSVIGKGKATFRVDSSCTVDCKGVVAEVQVMETFTAEPVAAPTKAAPAAVVAPRMETPGEAAAEA